MSTISDYTSLQAAAIEYLARDQDTTLIARIPTFIQFAEAKLNRLLFTRHMEQRSFALTDPNATEPEFIALPSDFQSMRRIRLSSVSGKPRLQFKNQQQMDEWRYTNGNTSGMPQFFGIFGTEIELAPTPDAAYTVEMVYRQNIPALNMGNTTNWLLTLAPDLYLYSTLLEAAPYMKEDDRASLWSGAVTTAISDLNGLGNISTFNAGPLAMRPIGVTP